MGSPRIASLLPSATEIVCALGAGAEIVGLSHECDFPPESTSGKPVLTSTRVRKGLPSAAIDRKVREILRVALAVYEVDVEALERARPSVIVTQDLCEVCAVSLEDVRRALSTIGHSAETGIRVVNLHPTCLEDVLRDVLTIGAAIGREREAALVAAGMRERLQKVRARAAAIPGPRPSVLTIEWLDPVMVGGTWMPELVDIAGGRALVTKPGDHAPTLSRDELERLAPEVVVIKPCGFDLARTRREMAAFLEGRGWPALQSGRVWIADGNAYFNRPGPRLADSAEILAACIRPQAFQDFAALHASAFEPAQLGDPSLQAGLSSHCRPVS
ncbi:MAG: ABC transporter substrate-binding protein [Planctomycetota bacterium]